MLLDDVFEPPQYRHRGLVGNCYASEKAGGAGSQAETGLSGANDCFSSRVDEQKRALAAAATSGAISALPLPGTRILSLFPTIWPPFSVPARHLPLFTPYCLSWAQDLLSLSLSSKTIFPNKSANSVYQNICINPTNYSYKANINNK